MAASKEASRSIIFLINALIKVLNKAKEYSIQTRSNITTDEYQDAILFVLNQIYPNEMDLLRSAVIRNTANNLKLDITSKASNMENTEIFATFVTAIAVIKPLLEIFVLLYNRNKRYPTKVDISREINNHKQIFSEKNEVEKYVDALINYHIEKNKNSSSST